MKIILKNTLEVSDYEGIILPIYEDKMSVEGFELPLDALKENKRFEAKAGSLYRLTLTEKSSVKEVVLLGLGKEEKLTFRKLMNFIADGFREAKKQHSSKIAVHLNNMRLSDQWVKAAAEAIIMADYSFDKYKTKKEDEKEILVDLIASDTYQAVVDEAVILSSANLTARDLVNEPANVMHPVALGKRAVELGKEHGFTTEVLGLKEIEELGMHSFLAVAKASSIEPQFIIMRYEGNSEADEKLGLVGKGLTYDSGGLSIKPTASMVDMKSDMAGAAAVIGAMCAIAGSQLKTNVTAVVAACENMIAGNAYKPGDIIQSMGGKSIFIGNTDAEGRLTLIDALHYIVTKENVSKVVDIATLTGAAIHCTGDVAAPAITNNDEFFKDLQKSYDQSGELIWRMPVFDEYKELLKHEEADLTNVAGSPGTITAGLFIGEFAGDLPWIHIDIAGPSHVKKTKGILSSGATGCGVKPLYYLAK